MRFSPLLSTILYTVSSLTRARAAQTQTRFVPALLNHRSIPLRAGMPIPFLSSLFGTSSSSSSDKMTSYPDKRTDDEWRTVLNKGKSS